MVQPGDDLISIANRMGITLEELLRLNSSIGAPGATILTPGPKQPAVTTYTIQPGDQLRRIADRYGVGVVDLIRFNNIANPENLVPGTQIRIPVTGVVPGAPVSYTIQPGEDLGGIATRFGITLAELVQLNPNIVSPGATLTTPAVPQSESIIYLVQPGDQLRRISERYGVSLLELIRLNNITNPERLAPGMQLRIPVRVSGVGLPINVAAVFDVDGTGPPALVPHTGLTVSFAMPWSSGPKAATPVRLVVKVSPGAIKPVLVDYWVVDSTLAGGSVNYLLQPGTLIFAPGETSKTITLWLMPDTIVGAPHSIVVGLFSPNGAALGSFPTHTYQIDP